MSTEFKLPNKKVKIVPILDRARGVIKDRNHEAYFLVGESSIEYCVPKDSSGKYLNVLTQEERDFFESKEKSGLTFEMGDLSPHGTRQAFANDKGKARNFWATKEAKVKLTKREKTLDLSDPMDYILYKVLLSNKDEIAPSWDERLRKATYRFAIVDLDHEVSARVSSKDKVREAYKALGRIENDPEAMINILVALGKKPSKTSERKFLIDEIDKQIDADVDKFLSIINDRYFETRAMINKAVNAGLVKKSGNRYYFGEIAMNLPGDLNDIKGACAFLEANANQDIKLQIEASLNDSE